MKKRRPTGTAPVRLIVVCVLLLKGIESDAGDIGAGICVDANVIAGLHKQGSTYL
jgi:hypothetical protein